MDCRLILEINGLLWNSKPLENITCTVVIKDIIQFQQSLAIPFPDKLIIDLPNFEDSITFLFHAQQHNIAQATLPLAKLFDRETVRFPIELYQTSFGQEAPSVVVEANIWVAYRQDISNAVQNVFEKGPNKQDSTVHPEKSGTIVLIRKEYALHEVQYFERRIFETITPDVEHNTDYVHQRTEIVRIVKRLNEKGEVTHQKKKFDEDTEIHSSPNYVPLFERPFEELDEFDEQEEDDQEFDDTSPSPHDLELQEKVPSIHFATESAQKDKPASQSMLLSEIKKKGSNSREIKSTIKVTEQKDHHYFVTRKEHAESLIGVLEARFGPSEKLSELKAVMNDVLKFSYNLDPTLQQGSGSLMDAHAFTHTISTPANIHPMNLQYGSQLSAPLQYGQYAPNPNQMQFTQSLQGPGNIQQQQIPQPQQTLHEDPYNRRQQADLDLAASQRSEIKIDTLRVPDQMAQTAPTTSGLRTDDYFNQTDPKKAATVDHKKKNKTAHKIHTREYLFDLNKSLKFAASAFVDEEMTKEIITQMSRTKKKLSAVRVKGPIDTGKEQLKLNVKNYFSENCSRKYLHYFMPYTKYLYLLNIEKKVDPTKPEKFQQIELDIDFDLSPHLKSLITPTGLLFVLAAKTETAQDSLDDSLGSCHLYHYSAQTLVEKATMTSVKRRSFGLIYFNKNLFAIGGYVQGQLTNSCERYDVRSNEWVAIASMERAVYEPTLCIYGNRYIFRFFGMNSKNTVDKAIERFDAIRNRWQTMKVDLQTSLRDIYLPLSYQISLNEILIFGGRGLKGIEATKGQAYLVSLDEKKGSLNLKITKCKNPLPTTGIFSTNSLFIEDNTIMTVKEGKIDFDTPIC